MMGANLVPSGVFSSACNAIRNASTKSKLPGKIPIQLLKKYPGLGERGEIVHVKSAFMRQRLYPNRYAVYAFHGPTIPVVEKKVKPVKESVKTPKTKETKKPEEDKVEPLSASELSSFFENLGSNSRRNRTSGEVSLSVENDAAEEVTMPYTGSEIREAIPATNTFAADKLPITKTFLSEYAFKVSGLEIPTQAMSINGESSGALTTIEKAGEYTWIIRPAATKDVRVSIVVK